MSPIAIKGVPFVEESEVPEGLWHKKMKSSCEGKLHFQIGAYQKNIIEITQRLRFLRHRQRLRYVTL